MSLTETLKNKRKVTIYGATLLALILIVTMYVRGRSKDPKYLTSPVRRGDLTSAVQSTGTINPLTTVPVGSYVSGTVQYIFADFNTRVRAGQVLAQLDPSIYEAQVTMARGNLANAKASLDNLKATIDVDKANLSKAQADFKYTQVNAKRTEDLFQQGVISTDQNDLTQSTLAQKDADVRSAQAQIEQAKAQFDQAEAQVEAMTGALQQAETNLRYTTILAPLDGTVVARNITVGQSVAASLQAPNVFTIAQDLKRMQVYSKTDESDTGSIHVGANVAFQVDAFPGEIFHGQVSAVRLNAYTVQNVVTYDTVVDFENPDEKLLPGETAYVTIPTGHAANTIEIPNAALTFSPDISHKDLLDLLKASNIPKAAATTHEGGWQIVWKVGPDKKPAPIAFRAGITDYSYTQVIDGLLQEGDQLITGAQAAAGTTRSPLQAGPGGGPRGGR